MIATESAVESLRRLQSSGGRVDFAAFLRACPDHDDDTIADLVEADGRHLLGAGHAVDLARYLDAVPEIETRLVVLDAAVDMSLRSLRTVDSLGSNAAAVLTARYPRFADVIRECDELCRVVAKTEMIGGRPEVRQRAVPGDFGPLERDGRARYVITRLLGHGAAGDVYLAVDRRLSEVDHEAHVALKILRTPHDEADPSRLFDEATKARRIAHPHVVRIEDCGVTTEKEAYIVYEHVAGGDVQALVERTPGPFPIKDAVRLVAKIARGLHAAHSAGVLHCDLKPGNVLLDSDGEPKVADFGLAVRLRDPGWAESERVNRLGNLAFMAPEQFAGGAGAYATAADVYSLGGILYFLLTRRLPNGETVDEVLARFRSPGPIPAPGTVRHGVPRDLDAVCRKALSTNPGERYWSAAELADDLERILRIEPLPWNRTSWARGVAMWARRRPIIASLTGALVIAVVGGTVTGARLNAIAAVERAQKEAELKAKEERKQLTGMMIGNLRRTKGADTSVLFESMIVEWLCGPRMLGDAEQLTRLWGRRLSTGREAVARAEREGKSGELHALMWGSTLGYWLTLDGDPAEAESVIAANRAKWAALLPETDPWMHQLDGIALCAKARGAGRLPDGASRTDALQGAALALSAWVRAHEDNGGVRLMALWTLRDLAAVGAIKDVGWVNEAIAKNDQGRLREPGTMIARPGAKTPGKSAPK